MMQKCKFVGNDYGGFPCCLSLLDDKSVVWDFGVGEDISFALGVQKAIGCNIELFDFTPDSISWFNENCKDVEGISYNEYGISDYDGMLEVYDYGGGISRRSSWMGYESNEVYPVKCISTILKEKEIEHIDLLKLDIEGEEYKVIPYLLKKEILPTQICVEEHMRFLKSTELHDKVFRNLLQYYELMERSNQEYCFVRNDYENI